MRFPLPLAVLIHHRPFGLMCEKVCRAAVNDRLRLAIGSLGDVRITMAYQPADPITAPASNRCVKSKIGTRTRPCEVE